jgi:hypothetical protein
MNRLSTDNLVEDITEELLVQLSGPYTLYRNSAGDTNGIWFYEPSDGDKALKLIDGYVSLL